MTLRTQYIRNIHMGLLVLTSIIKHKCQEIDFEIFTQSLSWLTNETCFQQGPQQLRIILQMAIRTVRQCLNTEENVYIGLSFLNEPSSNGDTFCNTTNEGGGVVTLTPEIFKMSHRMILILVPVVSLESPLNIDTKISTHMPSVWLL